eukprot:298542_1
MSNALLHGNIQNQLNNIPKSAKYAAISTFILDVFIISALSVAISSCLWTITSLPTSAAYEDCWAWDGWDDWYSANDWSNQCSIPVCVNLDDSPSEEVGLAYCDNGKIVYDQSGAPQHIDYDKNNYWAYAIVLARFYIYYSLFWACMTALFVIVVCVVWPIFMVICILLLILAIFAWILGFTQGWNYFTNLIKTVYESISDRVSAVNSYIFKYFVWKKYQTMFFDVVFLVGQFMCAINLIVFVAKNKFKNCSCDLWNDESTDIQIYWNGSAQLLVDDGVLINYFVIPYIVLTLSVFVSRGVLNRIFQKKKIKHKSQQLVFLVLFVDL